MTRTNREMKGSYSAEEEVIELQSESLGNASVVKDIKRVFQLVGGDPFYEVQMATDTVLNHT